MIEQQQRPPRERASISIGLESGEYIVKGKWHDGDGKKHDLGFAKLPTHQQAKLMLCGMADRLEQLMEDKKNGH